MPILAISKELSANDTGETGGHQVGILIPKEDSILGFFPKLDATQKNPRHILTFIDEAGGRWVFAFIYYNNKFFGGTRNEYRLTRMTTFFQNTNLKAGDTLILIKDAQSGGYRIQYKRKAASKPGGALKLGSSWREIKL
jgi:acetyl-CoA carboxylase carboxyltransferase component